MLKAVKGGWVREMKVTVHHWRFEDGVKPINPGNTFGEMILPRGWYCWAYADNDKAFEEWMGKMCPTADVTHRFNSGNPMYTVYIKDDNEATVFTLKWLD